MAVKRLFCEYFGKRIFAIKRKFIKNSITDGHLVTFSIFEVAGVGLKFERERDRER